MAVKRVYHAAAGAATGDAWADAYTTLQAGLTNAGAGGVVLVDSRHSETFAASQTLASAGTNTNPLVVITTNGTDTVYAAPAAVNFSVTNAGADITFTGSTLWYGIWLSVNDDFLVTASNARNTFAQGCTLELTGTTSRIECAGANQSMINFVGCNLHWSNAAPGVQGRFALDTTASGGIVLLEGVTITDAGNPTNIFVGDAQRGFVVTIRDTDLNSAVWSGNLFSINNTSPCFGRVINCKVHASLTYAGTIGGIGSEVSVVGCDDGTGNKLYEMAQIDYYGSTTIDDANYNNAGASDGTNRLSWKVVTNALPVPYYEAHRTPWITGWINSTGAKTLSVEFNTNNVAIKDDEIWLEVEYLGTAASTQASTANDRLSPISGTTLVGTASGANQASGSSTWTSPGIATDLVQKVSVAATVNRVGPFRARVAVAKPSETIWIDPLVTIS